MELKVNDTVIKYDEINVDYTYPDGTKITYPNANIHEVKIKNATLDMLFKLFNESNYNVVERLYIAPEFEEISNEIFDAISTLSDKKEYLLARSLADYYFERFTILWQYFLMHQRHVLGTVLWQHVCRIIWNWEKKNSNKIHKGTPYFFLGENLLRQGNIDIAFLFIYNAIEEDKRFSNQYGDANFYKHLPAYMFASIVDNPRNRLYPFVNVLRSEIKNRIDAYNSEYGKHFSFADFDKKFLENNALEWEKYLFVYSLNNLKNSKDIVIKELENNEFSRLKNLDTIFNLCLVIDNIIGKNGGSHISDRIQKLCKSKSICAGKTCLQICESRQSKDKVKKECCQIYDSLGFGPNKNMKQAINDCLSLNYPLGKPVRKEILNLIFIWGLRNYGGHNIESETIFVEKFEEILQLMFNGLFIILE